MKGYAGAGAGQATLPETVPVGNPGNRADDTGYGAVAYRYEIGKYEVTNAQYCEFLNAVAKTDTYGTFDQNGNMWEWNETRAGGNCGVRGGSFYLNDRADYLLSSARWVTNPPTFEFSNYGFRVVVLGAPGSKRR